MYHARSSIRLAGALLALALLLVPLGSQWVRPAHGAQARGSQWNGQQCLSTAAQDVHAPDGTDLSALSDAALACYGVPQRPTVPAAQASWAEALGHARHWAPLTPHELDGWGRPDPAHPIARGNVYAGMQTTQNWAGWALYASKQTGAYAGGSFKEATGEAVATKPTDLNNHNPQDQVSTWVGLGGNCPQPTNCPGTGNPIEDLLQAGILVTMGSAPTISFAAEDECANGCLIPWTTLTDVHINWGDTVYYDLTYTASNSTMTVFVENVTSGTYHSYTLPAAYHNGVGTTAEHIWENQGAVPYHYYPSFPPQVVKETLANICVGTTCYDTYMPSYVMTMILLVGNGNGWPNWNSVNEYASPTCPGTAGTFTVRYADPTDRCVEG